MWRGVGGVSRAARGRFFELQLQWRRAVGESSGVALFSNTCQTCQIRGWGEHLAAHLTAHLSAHPRHPSDLPTRSPQGVSAPNLSNMFSSLDRSKVFRSLTTLPRWIEHRPARLARCPCMGRHPTLLKGRRENTACPPGEPANRAPQDRKIARQVGRRDTRHWNVALRRPSRRGAPRPHANAIISRKRENKASTQAR